MHPIPTVHTSQAYPFIHFLIQAGCPVHRFLKKTRLPAKMIEPSNAYIAEQKLWELLDVAADNEGIEHFGLEVGLSTHLEELGDLTKGLCEQTTFYSMLNMFCAAARKESSHGVFWLELRHNKLYFCRVGIPWLKSGQYHAEMYVLTIMIKVVQIMASENWLPANILLQTQIKTGVKHYPFFTQTNIKFGQKYTAIEIPLMMENELAYCSKKENTNSFVQSIKQILPLYIADGHTSIDIIAEITGHSTRTIQRHLKKFDKNYRELLQQVRFEMALKLLKESSMELQEIASELSYSNQSHFNRAFVHYCGIPPGQYRQLYFKNL